MKASVFMLTQHSLKYSHWSYKLRRVSENIFP